MFEAAGHVLWQVGLTPPSTNLGQEAAIAVEEAVKELLRGEGEEGEGEVEKEVNEVDEAQR